MRSPPREILDVAVESGINFIDTANVYGGPPLGEQNGQTEEIIGRWIADHGDGFRDRIVLATKVYGRVGDGPNDEHLSAAHIRRAIENSLRRLKTDHVDLYQMHHIDRRTPIDEIFEAFTVLRDQGKILYLGSSNFAGWNLAQYQEFARATGRIGLVSEQSTYSLVNRALELEVIPAALNYGVGVLPYSPLAGGVLAGILQKADLSRSAGSLSQPGVTVEKVTRYESLAKDFGFTPAELGISWLLHQPAVTAPVVGPSKLSHLTSAIAAVGRVLSADQLAELDAVWPGRGGAAPEAYAW